MRWKAVSVVLIAAVLVVGGLATVAEMDEPLEHRYLQHVESQQLADLTEQDRAAASSLEIDPGTFASHLPVISIDTHGQDIPGGPAYDAEGNRLSKEDGSIVPTLAPDGSETIEADVRVFDAQGSANRLSDDPTQESSCLIRVRGNSSRIYDKKNYRIELVDNEGDDNSLPLLGMASGSDWALQGTSIDKTMMRNYLTYNIAGGFIDDYVPSLRYCEVFINGEYNGLYLLTEMIRVGEGRLELNEGDPDMAATSYVIAIDERSVTGTTFSDFLHYTLRIGNYFDVIYPGEGSLTQANKEYIAQDLGAFEKALYSYDYDSMTYGYWGFIDVESFVDGFIVNEFVVNDDFGAFSTYLYKDLRGKITLGPIWDYDNAYDNYQLETSAEGFYLVERPWYYMLFKDESFCEDVISRYRGLREDELSDERLLGMVDATYAYIEPALARNWEVWGYTFDSETYIHPEERRPGSCEEAVDDLKGFIVERGAWLDRYIENLRQYSHESMVKKFNH